MFSDYKLQLSEQISLIELAVIYFSKCSPTLSQKIDTIYTELGRSSCFSACIYGLKHVWFDSFMNYIFKVCHWLFLFWNCSLPAINQCGTSSLHGNGSNERFISMHFDLAVAKTQNVQRVVDIQDILVYVLPHSDMSRSHSVINERLQSVEVCSLDKWVWWCRAIRLLHSNTGLVSWIRGTRIVSQLVGF